MKRLLVYTVTLVMAIMWLMPPFVYKGDGQVMGGMYFMAFVFTLLWGIFINNKWNDVWR